MAIDDTQLREIFETAKVIASVGLSSKTHRPSYKVCRFLQEQGYRIVPVNPHETEVLGEKASPDIASVPKKIDVVQIFRRPEAVPGVVEEAIEAEAGVIWMQDGAGHPGAAEKAREAGLTAVVDDCMLRQFARLDDKEPIEVPD